MAVTVIYVLASWLTDNQTRFLQFLDFQLQFNFFSFAASVTASFFLISLFAISKIIQFLLQIHQE